VVRALIEAEGVECAAGASRAANTGNNYQEGALHGRPPRSSALRHQLGRRLASFWTPEGRRQLTTPDGFWDELTAKVAPMT